MCSWSSAQNWLNDLSTLDHVLAGASPFTSHHLKSFSFPGSTTQITSIVISYLQLLTLIIMVIILLTTARDRQLLRSTLWKAWVKIKDEQISLLGPQELWAEWGGALRCRMQHVSMIKSYSRRELLEMREGVCYVYLEGRTCGQRNTGTKALKQEL